MNQDILNSIKVLKNGGTILYPTDTVWGIGCDATNYAAVDKVFKIKLRDDSKALIVLVNSIEMLERYVDVIPEIALQLIEVADKPLTIIYPRAVNIAENIISEDGSIGIRIVNEPFCNELIKKLNKPIVSTSANISGKPAPEFFSKIDKEIIEKVDYVVKYRQNEAKVAKPSSIIKVGLKGEIKILRY
jgi:L-threonylcarbamoyladenylate synthase